MFSAIPEFWKQLCDAQWREVDAIIGSFYDEYHSNPDTDP